MVTAPSPDEWRYAPVDRAWYATSQAAPPIRRAARAAIDAVIPNLDDPEDFKER
ncbi:MAG: hypothetical protein ACYCZN_15825 [Candidatus Dormibacteria bacterium]